MVLTSSQWSNSYRFFLSPVSTSLKRASSSSSLMKFCLTSTCPRTTDNISWDDPYNHLHSSLLSGPFRKAELSDKNLHNKGFWKDFLCTCFETLISSVILSRTYDSTSISTIISVLLSLTGRHFEFAKISGTWSIWVKSLQPSSGLALYSILNDKIQFHGKLWVQATILMK